jgi:hypothetical protein
MPGMYLAKSVDHRPGIDNVGDVDNVGDAGSKTTCKVKGQMGK